MTVSELFVKDATYPYKLRLRKRAPKTLFYITDWICILYNLCICINCTFAWVYFQEHVVFKCYGPARHLRMSQNWPKRGATCALSDYGMPNPSQSETYNIRQYRLVVRRLYPYFPIGLGNSQVRLWNLLKPTIIHNWQLKNIVTGTELEVTLKSYVRLYIISQCNYLQTILLYFWIIIMLVLW